jgi:uncharacterized protein YcbK (DUF882 family)
MGMAVRGKLPLYRRMNRRSLLVIAAAGIAAARTAKALPRPPPLWRLKLVNAHTGETFNGAYRDDKGPIARVMEELSVFLRDHYTGEKIAIDVGVIDFLADVMDSVGATGATILSAYRTPETNAMLARTTFGVAENSQHLYGRALDVYLPTRLEDAMEVARKMRRGGVGWYPQSGFFHLDTGPLRNWTLAQRGLGRLLLDAPDSKQHLEEPLSAASKDQLIARSSRGSLEMEDRLSMHQLLAIAERRALGR